MPAANAHTPTPHPSRIRFYPMLPLSSSLAVVRNTFALAFSVGRRCSSSVKATSELSNTVHISIVYSYKMPAMH
jgi:hypothetical protein